MRGGEGVLWSNNFFPLSCCLFLFVYEKVGRAVGRRGRKGGRRVRVEDERGGVGCSGGVMRCGLVKGRRKERGGEGRGRRGEGGVKVELAYLQMCEEKVDVDVTPWASKQLIRGHGRAARGWDGGAHPDCEVFWDLVAFCNGCDLGRRGPCPTCGTITRSP